MNKKVAVFVNDDFFSKYAFKKLKKDYQVFPFSLKKIKNFNSFVLKEVNLNLLFDFLKKNKIEFVFFAGKINQNIVFDNLHPSVKNFLSEVGDFKPEKILKKLVNFLEENEIKVLYENQIFKEEIVEEKIFTYPPTEKELEDIKFGFSVLKDIAKYNIGQSIIVKNGMVLGIEGIEGTDQLIKRVGKYCKDFVFIKGCSENKDLRFDMPVIGMRTIKNLIKESGKVIAVKAYKTIILQKEKVIEECKKNKIKLVGVK
ncbi:MAG: UDP-2,3-diacylglucosamine diphosphatase LpxI [Candidatus Omnitrophica bacterium]|nr:UDP-2,3-diacylglucosamine diphosphatase LpxI [Candidatus Omnitrophota bacterium]